MIGIKKQSTKNIKYYEVDAGLNSSFYSSWKMTNIACLQRDTRGPSPKIAWPDGLLAITRGPWTIPDYIEAPHFVISKKNATVLSDFGIIDGFMFISAKFRSILDELAPGSCDFRDCTTEFSNGQPGPKIWLCSVTKVFKDVVDLSKSKVSITPDGSYSFIEYLFAGGGNLVFFKETVEYHHIFHLAECGSTYFCDEVFKQACKTEKISGIDFKIIGELED